MPIVTYTSSIKNSLFPLIHTQFISPITSQEFEQWLLKMTDLLAKQQPFFAVYHSEPNLMLPDDYRVKEAQWYKAHKVEFFQYCQGLVRIANDDAERAKLDSPAMHQAWGVPYTVVMTKTQALTWLGQQIKKDC